MLFVGTKSQFGVDECKLCQMFCPGHGFGVTGAGCDESWGKEPVPSSRHFLHSWQLNTHYWTAFTHQTGTFPPSSCFHVSNHQSLSVVQDLKQIHTRNVCSSRRRLSWQKHIHLCTWMSDDQRHPAGGWWTALLVNLMVKWNTKYYIFINIVLWIFISCSTLMLNRLEDQFM